MADDMVPAWMVETAQLEERFNGYKELLNERYKTQEHNVEIALKTLTEKTAAHNEILAAWREDRANSPSRTELISTVGIVATIITVVMNIIA